MKDFKRRALTGSVLACSCFGLGIPLLAAETSGTVSSVPPSEAAVSAPQLAQKCLDDLRAFDIKLEKSGYWLSASGYGYGFAMGGFGYGYPFEGSPPESAYQTVRPGYEVRMLLASANILARHGQQQPCEDVLATTRNVYKQYEAEQQSEKVPFADLLSWRRQQIAAAQPVATQNASYRADQLLGIDVRDPQNQALGSVDDIVMSPQTGKTAYLIIARGGIFGIGEKYVPVPWENFKIAPNGNLLVLDANKGTMDGAPRVDNAQFATARYFDQESQKVDAYWKTHVSTGSSILPKG